MASRVRDRDGRVAVIPQGVRERKAPKRQKRPKGLETDPENEWSS